MDEDWVLCEGGAPATTAAAAAPATAPLAFTVNGVLHEMADASVRETLLDALRVRLGLCGTKHACGQGGCGACTVVIDRHGSGAPPATVMACLVPLLSLQGASVTTVEGVGGSRTSFAPVQTALADGCGSQCGFCSPGFVMSMYALLGSGGAGGAAPSAAQVEGAFDGNLCRCTGYRPILQSFRGLAAAADGGGSGRSSGSSGCRGAPAQAAAPPPPPAANAAGESWEEPASLAALCAAVQARAASGAQFVVCAGATGRGVFRADHADATAWISVLRVPEANVLQPPAAAPCGGGGAAAATGLVAGAAVTIEALRPHLPHMEPVLGKLASAQVRSAGSWAGNLLIAQRHGPADAEAGYFPSDLATLLIAAGASVDIVDAVAATAGGVWANAGATTAAARSGGGGVARATVTVSVESFLAMVYSPTVLLVTLRVPAPPAGGSSATAVFKCLKVMARPQNAHAAVNAALHVTFASPWPDNTVASACLAFGGAAQRRATQVEQALLGRDLGSPATLSAALEAVRATVLPAPCARSAAYNAALLPSAFLKLAVAALLERGVGADVLPAPVRSAGVPYHRPISGGAQTIDGGGTNPGVPRITARLQASGEAVFADDAPLPAGCLHAALVTSPAAAGTLVSVDGAAALALPGVLRVMVAADVPGTNAGLLSSPASCLFAQPGSPADGLGVCFYGQAVGMVVAATAELAERAAALVAVTVTPPASAPVVSLEQALAAGDAGEVIQTKTAGDIDAAFSAAAHVFRGETHASSQAHFYLENQTAVATPQEGGALRVVAACQDPTQTQQGVALATGLRASAVEVAVRRLGGGYGGKNGGGNALVPAACAALGAQALGTEVRCVVPLAGGKAMHMWGRRPPFAFTYEVAVDARGAVLGVRGDVHIANSRFAARGMDNGYAIGAWDVTTHLHELNVPQHCAMRAPGDCAGIHFIEDVMERVAAGMGLAPEAVKALNLAAPADARPCAGASHPLALAARGGAPPAAPTLPEMYAKLQSDAGGLPALRAANAAFNAANAWRKRGVATVPLKYDFAWSAPCGHGASIEVYADATIRLSVSGVEMGQGIFTKMAQIAALTLGLTDTSRIEVVPTTTAQVANTKGTHGSTVSGKCGAATQLCCRQLLAKMKPVQCMREQQQQQQQQQQRATTDADPDGDWIALVKACLSAGIDMSERCMLSDYSVDYASYSAALAVVEVDTLTGEVQVLRADVVYDTGVSMSPEIDLGQVEGAFIQGMGHFLGEAIVYRPDGTLVTADTWEYKVPCSHDVPQVFNTTLLSSSPCPASFLGAKAVGEPPICLASVVMFAIRDAVGAARQGAGERGWFRMDAPASAESVRLACPDAAVWSE